MLGAVLTCVRESIGAFQAKLYDLEFRPGEGVNSLLIVVSVQKNFTVTRIASQIEGSFR